MNNKSWLDKLEAKHPNWAIDGLIRYISLLMILMFILHNTNMLNYSMIVLNGNEVLNGQIWRLLTFLFIPTSSNPLYLFFELLITVMCAEGIEASMGSFKLTMYYLFGALCIIIASFIFPYMVFNSYYLYLSLFFGYATLFPNQELLLFFIIPIKIKYIAILSGIILIIEFMLVPWAGKIALLLAITNYILFFAFPAFKGITYEMKQRKRRNDFEKAVTPDEKGYRHKCSVCGKTDVSSPEMIFRYCTCSKCGVDGVAFCQDHLKEHKAQKGNSNEK